MNASEQSFERQHRKPGYVMFMRSPESQELLRDPLAFGLLGLIAFRARWRAAFSVDGLEFGEALIGDFKKYGITRWQYRERLERLVEWGLVTVRPTNKGTIVKLASDAVFDINIEPPTNRQKTAKTQPLEPPTDLRGKTASRPPSKPPTNRQRTANEPPLTNNERRKEGNDDTRADARKRAAMAPTDRASSSILVLTLEEARKHPLWKNFSAYCRSKPNGSPTLKGFNTWLKSQPPPPPRKATNKNGADAPPPITDEHRAAIAKGLEAFRRNKLSGPEHVEILDA